jgi:glyoxylase I family protein
MFKKVDHVELVMERLEETVAFYTEVLGFTVRLRERIPRSALGVPMDIAYLSLGETGVEMMRYDGAPVKPTPEKEHAGYRLLALEVEDMDRALALLAEKGYPATWGPRTGPHYKRAEIQDPNGNAIELRQWLSGRTA